MHIMLTFILDADYIAIDLNASLPPSVFLISHSVSAKDLIFPPSLADCSHLQWGPCL